MGPLDRETASSGDNRDEEQLLAKQQVLQTAEDVSRERRDRPLAVRK